MPAAMKTIKILTASLTLIFLAGCCTQQVWLQDGRSEADTQRDLDACRVEAACNNDRLTMTHHWHYNEVEDNFIYNCMIAKGYWAADKPCMPSGAPVVSQCKKPAGPQYQELLPPRAPRPAAGRWSPAEAPATRPASWHAGPQFQEPGTPPAPAPAERWSLPADTSAIPLVPSSQVPK
jgi:hypothetical protein